MNTSVAPNLAHPFSDFYDSDEVIPQNSPLLTARLNIRPSPTPPLVLPPHQASPPPSPGGRRPKHRKRRIKPSQGDAVLVSLMDSGRQPDIAITAGKEALPSVSSEDASTIDTSEGSGDEDEHIEIRSAQGGGAGAGEMINAMSEEPPSSAAMGSFFALKSLAADALGKLGLQEKSPENEESRPPEYVNGDVANETSQVAEIPPSAIFGGYVPARDDRSQQLGHSPYSSHDSLSPRRLGPILAHRPADAMSPPNDGIQRGELPPIHMASPRSDTNVLPSIRDHLGDQLAEGASPAFSGPFHSPPAVFPPLSRISSHGSPPVSPQDYRNSLTSPGHPLLSANHHYFPYANGVPQRSGAEYSSSNTETPSTDHSASTPATSTSIADHLSIHGAIYSNPEGSYICTFAGCKAPPFQTQYLLNSHANVHSSARPHYCPVQGCPRSEGGKGFKRKNEMIRHGLVHDSPGYVCPFCPDREHKYPRPDNLQRHVRVHHVDKDKDDPQLRMVLAQRSDGPSRGRRRRAVAS
ncbi:Krueppel-like factor 11 [Pleurostoma richardsiae]|uniref:Krueppel-like factor 11 n=1 Tax=Pleurostoma richardsiae TaxID=41990 RepID=A0AA38VIG3_9PEZI|nr:Krueppel-like factor 11 [Pleurostoma richardsiae]